MRDRKYNYSTKESAVFWIKGSSASVEKIQIGVNAAEHLCWQNNINPHKAAMANKAKHCGEPYNKQLDAAFKQARDTCFFSVYGEQVCWEPGAKFIFR